MERGFARGNGERGIVMDAARLVAEAERVMRGAPQPEQVIAEAWQAFELAEAMSRLIGADRPGAGGEGCGGGSCAGDGHGSGSVGSGGPGGLGESAVRERGAAERPVARAGPAPVVTGTGAGPPRAARLTGVRDPAGTVRALRVLLGEIGLALVDATCAAEDETAYWLCIEALDAVDEAKEQAGQLARFAGGEGGSVPAP